MVNPDNERLAEIAARLDRLLTVPTDVLADLVMTNGTCVLCYGHGDVPILTGLDTPDRELAARICADCPMQDECLELELRVAGRDTVGVWGALPEQDRQALYPLWRPRGHREFGESGCDEVPDGGDSA